MFTPCVAWFYNVLYIISCSSMFPDVGVILAFYPLGWSLGFIWLHLAYGYILVPGVYPMAHLSQLWCELCMCPSHSKGYLSSNLCINPHVLPMKLPCSLVISNVFTKTKLFFSMKALIFACFPSFSLVRSQFWCEIPRLDDHPTW